MSFLGFSSPVSESSGMIMAFRSEGYAFGGELGFGVGFC